MDFIRPLWKHQLNAVEQSFTEPNIALLFDPGTGKSATTINILRGRYATHKRVLRTLILCPQVVIPNWKNEFKLFSRIPQQDILALTGVGKKREDNLKAFLYSKEELTYAQNKIVITNYEALQNKEIMKTLIDWNVEALVCDESHKLKDPGGTRAKLVYQLSKPALYRYILTGTPILNSLMDLFMQYKILDDGNTFGQNFYIFRDRYFRDENASWKARNPQGYFPKWVPRPEMFDELQQRIYRKGLRALKSECLDLPPLVKTQRYVELSPEQKKLYAEMRDDFIAFIDKKTAAGEPIATVAKLAMTKALRLQQIVTGFIKAENEEVYRLKDVPRLKVLSEILEELVSEYGHKVIVWSIFKENYAMIADVCEKLGIKYTELHGDISPKQKQENIKEFRQGEAQVLIANQAAGGTGLNLIEATYAVYYSKGFRLEDDMQSEARNHRGGSEIHDKITRIDLVANGTIDELIDEALKSKLDMAERILDLKGRI